MGINWNEEQKRAIEERNKNILVSAAAGSGKTAVLVERIRRLIIDEKVPVERFLIVTFTKAAASEMKEKIIRALKKAAQGENVDRKYLYDQLEKVPTASISTFNSFALDVVRNYFYIAGVEPGFKTCDESSARLLKMEAIENTFEYFFEKEDENFLEFIRNYSDERSEDGPKKMVLELYNMIMSMPKPFEWLDEKTAALNISEEEFRNSIYAEYILKDAKACIKRIIDCEKRLVDILDENQCINLYEKYCGPYEQYWNCDVENLTFDEIRNWFLESSNVSVRLVAAKDEKGFYEPIKDVVKNLRETASAYRKDIVGKYFSDDIKTQVSDINKTYMHACVLRELVIKFSEEYKRLKTEKKVLDFSDQEHIALSILENKEVAKEYIQKFEYIFVDEYQDTNDVQEELISRISRKNNLFMVGDVKQSIYKFRLAEPEIFMRKYHRYAGEEEEESIRIDLNSNFRSKGYILNAVNDIFLHRMEGYEENAALKKGISYEGPLEKKVTLTLIDSAIDEESDVDDSIKQMKKAEIEASECARLIKSLIGQKIYVTDEQREREISYKDIVILLRSVKDTAPKYQEVLERMDIPCYTDDLDGYFDSVEVNFILNLLSLADNARQDIPLLSVLSSVIFSFSPDELSMIRIESKNCPYYEAFENYIKNGSDDALREKCMNAIEKINEIRTMAQALSLKELVWKVIWDTGYYTYAGALPLGEKRQANLRALADKAVKAQSIGIYDLYGFLKYIESVKEGKISVGQMKTISESDDVVRIMTVHKSKGLEYPVVIAAMMEKRFNLSGNTSNISMHKGLGIGLRYINQRKHFKKKTVIESVIDEQIKRESIEEEKRILYVELTRAKDMLFLFGTEKNVKEKFEMYSYGIKKDDEKTFLEYIAPAAQDSSNIDIKFVTFNDIKEGIDKEQSAKENLDDIFFNEEGFSDEIARRLSYTYPHIEETKMKYKYSVTELNKKDENIKREHIRKVNEKEETDEFSFARKGSIAHKVIENISFKGDISVEDTISMMVSKNIISEDESKTVNPDLIRKFIQSDIGKRISKAEKVYREKPFTYLMKKDDTDVLVQGIIDCFFEEDNELVLLDYKNTIFTDEKKIVSMYKTQLDIYADALFDITGKKVKEKYIYHIKEGKLIKI